MSFDTLRQAVIDRFDANWTRPNANVCRGANEDFSPKGLDYWVKIFVIVYDSENAAIGTDFQRSVGEIVVQCRVKKFTGEKLLNDLVDEVKQIFQNEEFNGVECYVTNPVRVGESGEWYQFNANTPFKYDVYS